jgi:hypothetical protein
MLPQPRFRQIGVPLDAVQNFVVDHVHATIETCRQFE